MDLFLIAALTFIASAVGTFTGFGTSTMMVPVLAMVFPLPITLLFAGIVHWFSDIWKISLFREGLRLRLIILFGIPSAIFAYVGATVILSISQDILLQILGVFLIVYSLFILLHPAFHMTRRTWLVGTGGAVSGFITGMFGIGGEIRALIISAFDLPKSVYIATIGFIALATDTVRIGAYALGGTRLDDFFLLALVVAIPASFAGAVAAKHMIDVVPQERFRTIVMIFLLVVGLKLTMLL